MRAVIVGALLALVFVYHVAIVTGVCEDWTLCARVLCLRAPDKCPEGEYLVSDDCGCCEGCSKEPKTGPCGTCGKDVICKESQPICKDNQITTIDYCGCCRVCKDLLDKGQKCTVKGPSFGVCKAGLRCINGRCRCDPELTS